MHLSNKADTFLINCFANNVDKTMNHAYHAIINTIVNMNAAWINTSKLYSIISA